MLATEYASYYKIEPQGESESDLDFRNRVSGALRDQGLIIEAHEAFQDASYKESDSVTSGIIGAMAQALYGNYGKSGSTQVGDDIAVGHVIKSPKPEMSPEMVLLTILLTDSKNE